MGKSKKDNEYCPSILDKPDYGFEKKAKSKRISKQVTNIIITVCLCVALAFGVFAVLRWKSSKQGETPTDASETTQSETTNEKYIYDYYTYLKDFADVNDAKTFPEMTDAAGYVGGLSLGGVKSIHVKNPSDEFVLVPKSVQEVQINSETLEEEEKTVLRWFVDSVVGKNIDGVTFSKSYTEFIVQDLLRLAYSSVYAEDGNALLPDGSQTYFEECGLDKPVAELTIQFAENSSLTVMVGSETPSGVERYIRIKSVRTDGKQAGKPIVTDRVFITPSENTAFYFKDILYFVEVNLFTSPEDETYYTEEGDAVNDKYFESGALTGFDKLSISGSEVDGTINFEICDANTPPNTTIYMMTSPRRQNADIEAIDNLLKPVSQGFTVATCLSLNATSAQKQQYGLNKPLYQVTYVVKNVPYVITVGNKITDGTYAGHYVVMVNGNPSIFAAAESALPFLNLKSIDYTNDKIFAADIEDVNSINVKMDGKNYLFELTHGEQNSDLVVKLNGKVIDTEQFRDFYIDILSITARGESPHVTDAVNSNPTMEVVLKYNKYSTDTVIGFYPYSERRYSCLLNGSGDWTIYSSTVDTIQASVLEFVE